MNSMFYNKLSDSYLTRNIYSGIAFSICVQVICILSARGLIYLLFFIEGGQGPRFFFLTKFRIGL